MNTFVPEIILDGYTFGKKRGSFNGAVMSVDIKGFTEMTSELIKHGKEGTEVISEMTTGLFDKSLDLIYESEGFVSSFAGDSFTAVFNEQGSGKHSCASICLAVAIKLKDELKKISIVETEFGTFNFSVRIGLGQGKVFWKIIEHENEKIFYFRGKAIEKAVAAQKSAEPGSICAERGMQEFSGCEGTGFNDTKNCNLMALHDKIDRKFEADQHPKNSWPEKLIKSFTGEHEFGFMIPEFREVISVFISCKKSKTIDALTSKILSMKKEYGFSHPHVDFLNSDPSVVIFFGAPVSYERNDSKAMSFLLALADWAKGKIRIKCGASKGTCYCGFNGGSERKEFMCLGDTTNLAARMLNRACWDQILVDENLSKVKGFVFSFLGEYRFKGKAEDINTYVLNAVSERQAVTFSGSIVGREKEKKKLIDFLLKLKEKENAGVAVVEGEPGVGKTRLVSEIKKSAQKKMNFVNEISWIYMPCDEVLRKSYGPVQRMIKDLIEYEENGDLKQVKAGFEKKFREFLEKIPETEIKNEIESRKHIFASFCGISVRNTYFEALPEKSRFEATVVAIKSIIKGASLIKPLVLEIDDSQWIDEDMLILLRRLFVNVEKYPFAVITEKRLSDKSSALDTVPKEYVRLRLQIRNFSLPEITLLSKSVVPGLEIGSAFLDFIERFSGGNPFFIEQIIHYMAERGVDAGNFDETRLEFEIPSDVNNLIVSRIDRLTPELKTVVKAATILGTEFSSDVLTEMLGGYDIDSHLFEGENQFLWTKYSGSKYNFRHAMIRETVYGIQLKKDLRRLHSTAGRAIEKINKMSLKNVYAELAYHFEKASDETNSIKYLKLAAEQAKRNYRNEEAAYYFRRLIEITEKKIYKAENKTELIRDKTLYLKNKAYVKWQSGKWREGITLILKALESAIILPDKKLKVMVMIDVGTYYQNIGETTRAGKYLKEARRLSRKESSSEIRALSDYSLGEFYMDRGNYSEALSLLTSALNYYKKNKKEAETGKVSGSIGLLHYYKGEYEKAKKYISAHINIARKQKNLYQEMRGLGNIGIMYDDLGDYRSARKIFLKIMRLSKKTGYRHAEARTLGNLAGVYLAMNKYEKALDYFREQIKISIEMGDDLGAKFPLINVASVFVSLGRYEEAERALNEFAQYSLKSTDRRSHAVSLGIYAKIEWRKKNFKKALRLFTQAIDKLEKMKVKYYSCFFRIEKAFLLLDNGMHTKALKTLGKAGLEAEKLKISNLIPLADITKCACNFSLTKNEKNKILCFRKLVDLAENSSDQSVSAKAYYYLWSLTKEDCGFSSPVSPDEFRNKALRIFESVYKKTGNDECRLYAERIKSCCKE
ncbi:tetratricopeptide repeat protein [candidate division WOR-3 bacterium]|nr:tetratricopeptide repeat protein [candidate division WOR-3 bacterium]